MRRQRPRFTSRATGSQTDSCSEIESQFSEESIYTDMNDCRFVVSSTSDESFESVPFTTPLLSDVASQSPSVLHGPVTPLFRPFTGDASSPPAESCDRVAGRAFRQCATSGAASKPDRPVKQTKTSAKVKINYCTDFRMYVLLRNFRKRGWVPVEPEEDWNLYWACIHSSRALFSVDSAYRMHDNQMINHFPNHYELSRKDMLVKNIKRYKRELDREQTPWAAKRPGGGKSLDLDFIPATFVLPNDFALFVDEFKKTGRSTWIMKPVGKAQGDGIFLIGDPWALKHEWSRRDSDSSNFDTSEDEESYVISKYIDKPLLITGKKFDLRLYVLVTSFHPLKAYLYKPGFCRISTNKFNINNVDGSSEHILEHLTNVSLQKFGQHYKQKHGNKLSVQNLRLFLEGTRGKTVTDGLFDSVIQLIVHSLKSVSCALINDRHCFECYGYDIIIDEDLKPWLIEVNASPSLSSTTAKDYRLKKKLIDNILKIVLPPNGVPNIRWNKQPSRAALGDFEPIIDEEITGITKFGMHVSQKYNSNHQTSTTLNARNNY